MASARAGYHAYREMLHYYAVRNLFDHLRDHPEATVGAMCEELAGPRERNWVNLGGQLVPEPEVDRLRADVREGRLGSWAEIHAAYDRLWGQYPGQKQRHALACLLLLLGTDALSPRLWDAAIDQFVRIQEHVRDQVYLTRKKDYDNAFRKTTFRNAEEMRATVGTAEDNAFVAEVRRETEELKQLAEAARRRV